MLSKLSNFFKFNRNKTNFYNEIIVIFILLTLTNIRRYLVKVIPL